MAKAKIHWYQGCHVGRGSNQSVPYGASLFNDQRLKNPDWYCWTCARAARLALAKESVPKPEPPKRTGPLQCSTKGCGSYAVNPEHHGRTYGVDLDLCDVCYWRKRAQPEPRPISEAPKDGSMVLICVPGCDPMWTIGVFDARQRWVDQCLAGAYVNPTHFLPLPPEVK